MSGWQNPNLEPVTLLLGPETYLANFALRRLRALARAAHPAGVEFLEISEYSAGSLLEAAAPSLFAEPRFIFLGEAGAGLADEIKEFLTLAPEAVYLVVRLANLAGSGSAVKKALAGAQLISCEELKREADRAAFVNEIFKANGAQADQDAVRTLLAAFSDDISELGSACEQLAAAAEGRVSRDLVDSIFQGRVETNSFKIADAALAGNAAEAIRLFRHGLATGIDLVALNAALAMRVRQLAKIMGYRGGAEALGMQQWQLERAKKDLTGRTELGLASLVRLAAESDHAIKGASRDPEYAVEKLLLAMASRD